MSKTKDLATILKSAICRTKVRHRPAPSKFYFPGLSTSSTFDPRLFPVSEVLQNSFNVILKEYKDLRSISKESDYANEENQLHKGRWDWNTYISQGTRDATFASQCPKTVELLESMSFPRLMSGTPYSYTFFSTMHKHSSIAAHNGPCNLRIRCHFPLIVPQGDCGMQVGDEIVRWVPGQPVFFDDCYEHKGIFGRHSFLFDTC
jgi:aspartate beta-hydroxylase